MHDKKELDYTHSWMEVHSSHVHYGNHIQLTIVLVTIALPVRCTVHYDASEDTLFTIYILSLFMLAADSSTGEEGQSDTIAIAVVIAVVALVLCACIIALLLVKWARSKGQLISLISNHKYHLQFERLLRANIFC